LLSNGSKPQSSQSPKLLGVYLALALFVALEAVVRLTSIEFLEQPEIFFVNLKKKYVETGKSNDDIIILGDSRSMSLEGHSPKDGSEFSVYNHSLPAMGPKYYIGFLKKYLRAGNKKPKMVLFAGSPLLYSVGYGPPLYDPSGSSTSTNESFLSYLKRRWKEGWERNIFATGSGSVIQYSGKQGDYEQLLWEFFGHRFLHQFSVSELWEHFDGIERVFLVSKAIPLLYESYKFHGAIRNGSSLENWKVSPDWKSKIEFCKTCENVEAGLCIPPTSQREDNWQIEEMIRESKGKYNISNRLKPQVVVFSKLVVANDFNKQKQIEESRTEFAKPNFQVLEDMIAYLKSEGIAFGFVYMPWVLEGEIWPENESRKKKLQAFLKTKEVPYFSFPKDGYPSYEFVDKIHYDCRGEAKLNSEFKSFVLPQVFRFLKSLEKSN
jgi:hypothetical protein